jgi:exopolysaccharide biosynthesis polyprenyl glycosylphosphotransferase
MLLSVIKLMDVVALTMLFGLLAILSLGFWRSGSLAPLIALRLTVSNALFMLILAVAWHYTLKMVGMYHSHRIMTRGEEFAVLARGVIFCTAVLFGFNGLLRISFIDLRFLYLFSLLGFGMLVSLHGAIRLVQWSFRHKGRNLRQVLIVGSNSRAVQLHNHLCRSPHFGYRVLGFVDSRWHCTPPQGAPALVADTDTVVEYLRRQPVDEIFITLPLRSHYEAVARLVRQAEEQGVLVHLTTDLFNLEIARARVDHIDGIPLMTLYTGQMYSETHVVKNMVDFVGGLALLVAAAPLMVVAAVAIKLSSPGPILFRQQRLGLNKRLFNIYKFRTMVVDAEQRLGEIEHLNERQGEAAFKIKHDPRVTAVGRLLRKSSIDELPQLLNVVLGDMSLVGPRPLPVRDYNNFDEDWQRRRFSVKPGITCIWQISGRDSISFERWMEMDMHYIDNWSLMLDLKILLRTIPATLFGGGAS